MMLYLVPRYMRRPAVVNIGSAGKVTDNVTQVVEMVNNLSGYLIAQSPYHLTPVVMIPAHGIKREHTRSRSVRQTRQKSHEGSVPAGSD